MIKGDNPNPPKSRELWGDKSFIIFTLTRLMPSGHLARQFRFVIPGAAITYWLRTPSVLAQIWSDAAPLARFVDFFFGFLSAKENNFRGEPSIVFFFLIPSLPHSFIRSLTPTHAHRPLVGASALSGLLTVVLFLYILLIPMIKGIPPNVRLVHSSMQPAPDTFETDQGLIIHSQCALLLVSVVERVWRAFVRHSGAFLQKFFSGPYIRMYARSHASFSLFSSHPGFGCSSCVRVFT